MNAVLDRRTSSGKSVPGKGNWWWQNAVSAWCVCVCVWSQTLTQCGVNWSSRPAELQLPVKIFFLSFFLSTYVTIWRTSPFFFDNENGKCSSHWSGRDEEEEVALYSETVPDFLSKHTRNSVVSPQTCRMARAREKKQGSKLVKST